MKIHKGDLIVTKDSEVDFTEITGILGIGSGVKFSAPKLETVGGYLYVSSNVTLPKLETVGGHLSVSSNVTLPKLETVGGYLYVYSNMTLECPKLETVGGDLYVYSNVTLPKLETVGGHLSVSSNVTLECPKLETVGGYLSVSSNVTLECPKLETVGGYLSVNSNVTLPKLETVGGSLSVNSNVTLPKLVNKNDKTAKPKCAAALALSFKKKGLIKIDGILSWLISRKRAKELVIFKVKIVGKLRFSFVVQRGEQYAHGETVKKAIESLRYKISDRDTSRFKKWTLKTKVSAEDAIQAYRAITGACEYGVRQFCESIKVPEKLTVKEAIKITQGKYGSQEFEKFFN